MRATDQALDEARSRIAKLEAELEKANFTNAELARSVGAYRAAHYRLTDAIGAEPGSSEWLVEFVVLKLKTLSEALTEVMDIAAWALSVELNLVADAEIESRLARIGELGELITGSPYCGTCCADRVPGEQHVCPGGSLSISRAGGITKVGQ